MSTRQKDYSSGGLVQANSAWRPGERVCSLEELYRAADIRLSRKVPVSKYFRDLDETLEKAKRRLMEQDLQYAYVFYMRYVTVVIKHLPNMPDYNKPEYTKQREHASKNAKKALTTLERLQPILQQRHEEYTRYLASLPRPKASVSTYSTRRGSGLKSQLVAVPEPLSVRRDSLEGRDDEPRPKIHLSRESDAGLQEYSLAETLKDLNINQGNKNNTSSSVYPQRTVPKVETLIAYPTVSPTPSSPPSLYNYQQQQQQEHGYSASEENYSISKPLSRVPSKPLPQPPLKPLRAPPAMPPRPGSASTSPAPTSPYNQASPESAKFFPGAKPAIPPKPQEYHGKAASDILEPNISGKDNVSYSDNELTVQNEDKDFMPPCVISSDHYSLTEGGVRMRPIQLPEGIFEEFIDIAEENTRANLETGAILCGKQIPGQEALVMTALIIPKQRATSDTFTMEHEEELAVEQMDRELITLGWIHTHPSQTCFMSSVDLHTQCSYQLMLPEAIAIVCSPRHDPRFGIFRLTDPSGIDVIQNCKEKSAFHPHDESKVIYTNADTGGHVVLSNYDFDIIDIRGV
ncbi:hypothetical protein GGI25_003422 [Coemansia spiralis]|uniref:MPN domain-containing protein n=2 Tax=Coemansia TaxID=4863 RepID=A0A9W8G616_9FUNG|nr:hypothetical protein BX070DRAFT_218134 [Coemansia spiralis]KAJ1994238.1 hypothetical protein EDC05_001680 [Coemansia umbellata]KAJ2621230.1 hypothetical protein GGI26_004303 [Coemansia sp. RSA 1358]KAJ2676777.1 hypothetical protein GGI25_003422 [Coemansia spiralis]